MLKLVYGCLAFSLVAGVIIFVAAAGQDHGFRGMTKSMGDAITQDAKVLDADRYGAITQTGNGHVAGFTRDGDKKWSVDFDRFAESPANPYGAGAEDALAWCIDDASSCPGGILRIGARYESVGGASPELAAALNSKPQDQAGLLAVPQSDQAFVRVTEEGSGNAVLALLGEQATTFPITDPKVVQPRVESSSALVGSGGEKIGEVSWLKREGSTWRKARGTITEPGLQNACSSDSEIATVSTRVRIFDSIDAEGKTIGERVSGGVCTFTYNLTVTVVFNSAASPESVQVANYKRDGTLNWKKDLGAQKLLSSSGSPYVVAQKADGTLTVYSVFDGRILMTKQLTSVPFVGPDGSVVSAGRDGDPIWLMQGKGPETRFR
ncbi:MAG: hypothetical protein ACRDKE_01975 [Solirubrobacterales bacterium]